ncbi:signal peptidase II [Sediminihabitans luteus]|uniref:Lipoprotein signal peptidase n=1 Tax=Sediminihabitans luteus TaxID=1138585 RepID=A0A2M9CCI6_9CELL|nr:signal peptidase II [Sediminihabitans luteus]PJJ69092.1 signal peptidase II [Sediminihabitans luteus]GII99478.1 lipoprotein signal peptidase [Sediminihabitans luteus]
MPTPAPDDRSPSTTRGAGPRRALIVWTAVLAVLVIVLDQLTKVWAEDALADRDRIPVIGDLLGLDLVFNPGAALGIGNGMTWILTIVVVAVVVVVVRMTSRIGSRGWAIAFGLLLGGAIGNLIDRLTNEPGFGRGHVVDFIDYGVFIGNVADVAIVAAAVMIALLAILGIGIDGSRVSSDEARTGDATADDGAPRVAASDARPDDASADDTASADDAGGRA